MKNKTITRIVSLLLLMLSVLTVLTGCMRSGVGIVIHEDDTGDVELSFGIEKGYYDSIAEQNGYAPYDGHDTVEIKDGDTTYICVAQHKAFRNLDELKQILLDVSFSESDFESLFSVGEDIPEEECDCEDCQNEIADEAADTHLFKTVEIEKDDNPFCTHYTLHLVTDAIPADETDFDVDFFDADSLFKVLVSVTMPGTVTAEGAAVNGNSASYKLTDLSVENTIHVESEILHTETIIVTVAVLIAVMVLIGVIAKNNRKKSNNKSN